MAQIKCGHCKQTHTSVSEVRACAKAPAPAPAESYKAAVLNAQVPESRYAVDGQDGQIVFYEVKRPKKGKWAGYVFVDRLVGHPGDFLRYPVKGAAKATVLGQIGVDAKAAAFRFSQEFTVCACCGSPLSDPESLATGFGPVCITRFAA